MTTVAGPDLTAVRRRGLRVLVGAQVLGGLGQAAGGTAGALLARDIAGTDAAAGLPLALLVAGSAAAAIPISNLSRRAGRRPGLAAALLVGALGAALCVLAGVADRLALLLLGSVLFGAGNTAVMLARYAAADLSEPERRARTIGTVVFATTFGAVAGPNLIEPMAGVATSVGLPRLTGLFVLASFAYVAAASVLLALLRPDPLHLATTHADDAKAGFDPFRRLLEGSAVRAGLATIVLANLVMVAVMAMTPVHMRHHDHSLAMVGFVISLQAGCSPPRRSPAGSPTASGRARWRLAAGWCCSRRACWPPRPAAGWRCWRPPCCCSASVGTRA